MNVLPDRVAIGGHAKSSLCRCQQYRCQQFGCQQFGCAGLGCGFVAARAEQWLRRWLRRGRRAWVRPEGSVSGSTRRGSLKKHCTSPTGRSERVRACCRRARGPVFSQSARRDRISRRRRGSSCCSRSPEARWNEEERETGRWVREGRSKGRRYGCPRAARDREESGGGFAKGLEASWPAKRTLDGRAATHAVGGDGARRLSARAWHLAGSVRFIVSPAGAIPARAASGPPRRPAPREGVIRLRGRRPCRR